MCGIAEILPGAEPDSGIEQVRAMTRALTDRAPGDEGSVGPQLVGDVSGGFFLPRVLESSAVNALTRRQVSGALQASSIGFEGPGVLSELHAAREIARSLDSDHHELMMELHEVTRGVERRGRP